MKSDLYIVQHTQFLEQTDILECSCDSILVDLDGLSSGNILTIQNNTFRVFGLYTPVSRLNTVVFPAPFGPIRPYSCPFSMVDVKSIYGFQIRRRRCLNSLTSNIAMITQPPLHVFSYFLNAAFMKLLSFSNYLRTGVEDHHHDQDDRVDQHTIVVQST